MSAIPPFPCFLPRKGHLQSGRPEYPPNKYAHKARPIGRGKGRGIEQSSLRGRALGMAQLKAALRTLAAEFVRTAPPEVGREFPDFAVELGEMLGSSTPSQLQGIMGTLECEASGLAAVSIKHVLRAFHAAVDIHRTWICMGAAGAGAAAYVDTSGPFEPQAPRTQLEELLADPPLAVAAQFPDFEPELRAMLELPVDELRERVVQLEKALASLLERRIFSEARASEPEVVEADGVHAQAGGVRANVEAQALYFSWQAMTAAIHEAEALADVDGLNRVMSAKALRRSLSPAMGEAVGGGGTCRGGGGSRGHSWSRRGGATTSFVRFSTSREASRPMLPHELGELQSLLPGALEHLQCEGMATVATERVEEDADDCMATGGAGTTGTGLAADAMGSTAGTGEQGDAASSTGGAGAAVGTDADASPEPFCFQSVRDYCAGATA